MAPSDSTGCRHRRSLYNVSCDGLINMESLNWRVSTGESHDTTLIVRWSQCTSLPLTKISGFNLCVQHEKILDSKKLIRILIVVTTMLFGRQCRCSSYQKSPTNRIHLERFSLVFTSFRYIPDYFQNNILVSLAQLAVSIVRGSTKGLSNSVA